MDDKALVSRILKGERDAFIHLINENKHLVSHMIARMVDNKEDREEIAQDVFLKVHEKLAGFKHQSKLSTWIATIAYRMSVNHLVKSGKNPEENLDDFKGLVLADQSNPEQIYSAKDSSRLVLKLVEKLPVHYRTVLTLYHLEEFTYKEIEEVTGLPEGTLKSYLFRARKLLKEQLDRTFVKEALL